MAHNKYSHLTTSELLFKVDAARNVSSVIDELANRLECRLEDKECINRHPKNLCCPACEAQLNFKEE